MIWIKRLIPLAVLAVGAFLYSRYGNAEAEVDLNLADKYALITAQVWTVAATYRTEPDTFAIVRDSILSANGLSLKQMNEYLHLYEDTPEDYLPFAQLVKKYVDSLSPLGSGPVPDSQEE